jgi:hypothetical protein
MKGERRFRPGDRVRTIYAVGGIPAGRRGTVVQAVACAPVYDVQFDGDDIPLLVMHYKLVPDLAEPSSKSDAS